MLSLLRRRLRLTTATSRWPAVPAPSIDRAQPVFDAARCDLNGACARVCPVGAIVVDTRFALDRARCISCSRCIEVCPTGALAQGLTFAVPERTRKELVEPRTAVATKGEELAARAHRVLGRSLHVRH